MSIINIIRTLHPGTNTPPITQPPVVVPVVEVAGHEPLPTGGSANFGAAQYLNLINCAHTSRIRQPGKILKVSFYLANKPARITSFKLIIWRSFDQAYSVRKLHEVELSSYLQAGLNEIKLPTPLSVIEGDMTGIRFESSAAGSDFIVLSTAPIGRISNTSSTPTPSVTNWGTVTTANYFNIRCWMERPDLIITGDSIMAGFNYHMAYMINEGYFQNFPLKTIPSKIYDRLGISYQNCSVGNTTANEIEAWFDANVVALNPKYCLIAVGVNDAATFVSLATYQTKILSMLSKCQTAGIIPILSLILPWTNGNAAQHLNREEKNDWIISYGTSNGILILDARASIGVDRVGYYAGNRQDIQAGKSDDGVHLKELGMDGVVDDLEILIRTNIPQIVRR